MTEKNNTTTESSESHVDAIWDFFCSLKLTIIILLLLAITSIIGTVLQQNAPAAEYIQEYGEANYKLFTTLQFTDMYHSWWFIGLLGLFSVNLICCSIKNFPRAWKFFKQPILVPTPGVLKNSANRAEYSSKENSVQLIDKLSEFLKKEFSTPVRTDADGKTYLFAQKGIYSRFGAYMTHLSILVIMLGAIVGNLYGFKGSVNITEGAQTDKIRLFSNNQFEELGFTVRCDDFDVSYYPGTMRPRDYNSDLVVIDNGQEVVHKRIEVNDPLTYKGITFYQASYGPAGGAYFNMRITNNNTEQVSTLRANRGQHVRLPGGYSFSVDDFAENGRFGPAVRVHVNSPDGKHGTPFMVLKNYPDFDARRGGVFSFSLLSFEQPQFTGLQVAKDPGVEIVWLGCILMVFGSLTAFFFSHKRIWICLEENDGKTNVTVAANAHRNQPGFSLAFDELKQKLENTIENKSPEKEG